MPIIQPAGISSCPMGCLRSAWMPAISQPCRATPQVSTLERLRDAGPGDYYTGDIAQMIASDMAAIGGKVTAQDLAAYEAQVMDAQTGGYRGATVHVPPGLNAGPTPA